MNKSSIFAALAFAALAAFPNNASATHKNWVLKNAGNQCSLYRSDGKEWYGSSLWWSPPSGTTSNAYATCPVSLSGRWGNSGAIPFSPNRKAQVMHAMVYANAQQGKAITCTARARMYNNFLYWGVAGSATSATPAGNVTVFVNSARNDWGGDLQTHRNEEIVSLDIGCTLPPWSGIDGYKVKLCQFNTDRCRDTGGTAPTDSDATNNMDSKYTAVQTSAIECVAQNDYGDIRRSADGIKNHLTSWTGEDYVQCPLTPPSDDSDTPDAQRTTRGSTTRALPWDRAQGAAPPFGRPGARLAT